MRRCERTERDRARSRLISKILCDTIFSIDVLVPEATATKWNIGNKTNLSNAGQRYDTNAWTVTKVLSRPVKRYESDHRIRHWLTRKWQVFGDKGSWCEQETTFCFIKGRISGCNGSPRETVFLCLTSSKGIIFGGTMSYGSGSGSAGESGTMSKERKISCRTVFSRSAWMSFSILQQK